MIVGGVSRPSYMATFVEYMGLTVGHGEGGLGVVYGYRGGDVFPSTYLPVSTLVRGCRGVCGVGFGVMSGDGECLRRYGFSTPLSTSVLRSRCCEGPLSEVFGCSLGRKGARRITGLIRTCVSYVDQAARYRRKILSKLV